MPIYNCVKYLEDAIRSVLSSGIFDIEIIAVDDMSSDGSRELLMSLAKAHSEIKPILNDRNLGVAESRNIALSAARGEYIAFCDADDIVIENAYKNMLDAADGRDMIIGAHADLFDSGEIRHAHLGAREKASLFLAAFSVSCLWTKLIRRDFILHHDLTFDSFMKIGEDVVFLADLVTVRPSFKVLDILVYYHCHHSEGSPSLNHTYTFDAFYYHILCRERVLRICEDFPECRDFIYLSFSSFITEMLDKMRHTADIEEAFNLYRSHMLSYDFNRKKGLFKSLVGIPYDKFTTATAEVYFRIKDEVTPREKVLWEFRSGRIGFRFIVKYFIAWIKFKLKITEDK